MKTKFIKIKCMAKNCKIKIIIEVNKIMIDNKEQFNNKLKEIKNYYTKNNLNNKFIKDISTTVVNKYNKNH